MFVMPDYCFRWAKFHWNDVNESLTCHEPSSIQEMLRVEYFHDQQDYFPINRSKWFNFCFMLSCSHTSMNHKNIKVGFDSVNKYLQRVFKQAIGMNWAEDDH